MYYGHVLPSYVTKATSFLLEGGLLCVACIVVSGWGLGGGCFPKVGPLELTCCRVLFI